jgi:uncharacterized surface protein with fasciclin (FAS1) repeats
MSTNLSPQLSISSTGAITAHAIGQGVVHSSGLGTLSSSLVVGADIAALTIETSSLKNSSSTNAPSTVVVRDPDGAFEATRITITGNPVAGSDAVTKTYVDNASIGLLPFQPAELCTQGTNSTLSGLGPIDGITPTNGARVLVISQTNSVQNGLYSASTGGWLRTSDLPIGSTVGKAYVPVTGGITLAGDAFICSTPTAVVNSNPITFLLFSSVTDPTGLNLGGGAPVFASALGNQLSFRTIVSDGTLLTSSDSNTVIIRANSASANTPSTIVIRDPAGNFSASQITGSLTGIASLNLPLVGGTLTGFLQLPAGSAPVLRMGTQTCGISAVTPEEITVFCNGVAAMRIGQNILSLQSVSTGSSGILHCSPTGTATVSLVTDSDIENGSISDVKLQQIVSANKVANSATTASSINQPSSIVARDESGNFFASTITAGLTGLASLNLPLSGGVLTGQLQIPIGSLGEPALKFGASSTGISTLNPNEITLIGAGAMVIASSATATYVASLATTTGIVHSSNIGLLSNSLVVNADIADVSISDAKLQQLTSTGKVANSATTAAFASVPDSIVARNSNGDFSAGTITASVTGLASLNVPLAGGVMTGGLVLPTSIPSAPALMCGPFTGISGGTSLDFSVLGNSEFTVSASGISASSMSEGVVHSNGSGEMTSYLIVNSDIADSTISNDKLATDATSNATPQTFVLRDLDASFDAKSISLDEGTSSVPSLALDGGGTGLFGSSGTVNISTLGINRLAVASSGTLTLGAYSTGILHSGAAGELTSSLVVNSDIADLTITDSKLAQIATAGKVANTATTATSTNTNDTIVARDGSGNFAATTITASLTGLASLNLPLAGGTMTGAIAAAVGTLAAPSVTMGTMGLSGGASFDVSSSGTSRLSVSSTGITASSLGSLGIVHASAGGELTSSLIVNDDITVGTIANDKLATPATALATASTFVLRDVNASFAADAIALNDGDSASLSLVLGSSNTGIFGDAGTVNVVTAGVNRLAVSGSGALTLGAYSTGVLHSGASGELTSSPVVNSDIADLTITDAKLAQITTAGKVANSATTATSANTNDAIVARDSSGNFAATTITASLTGLASLNLPLAGGTMTGAIAAAVGTLVTPSVTMGTMGLSGGASFNVSSSGASRLNVSSTGITASSLASFGIVHSSAGGALTSSLVVNGDITVGTIANDKLATAATALATASTFVLRDANASFATDAIVLGDGDAAAPSLVLGSANTGIFGDTGTVNVSTAGVNRLAVSGSGALTLGAYSTGILHSGASGELTSSLIVNSDIADLTITDAKLAQIATAGKVANSATTATSANTNDAIVARDGSGNFAATTITAALVGLASLNLPLAGGTMTGAIAAIAGTLAAPSVTMGTMGLSGGASFNVSSSGTSRLNVSSTGIAASSLASLGIVHASAGGALTSSLVVNGDIAVGTIANDKLATAATALATASTFVLRDANASFAADAIILNDGDSASPSLVLGSANTGIFGDAGTVNISTAGVNRFAVSATGEISVGDLSTGIVHSGAAGELTSSLIVNSDIADLTITDAKLAQIATAGKVANSATTATSANTNDAIVARDGSGNFAATTITAALVGLASLNLPLAGGTMTGAIAAIAGTLAAPSVTMGTMGLSGGASFNVSSSGTSRLNVSSTGIAASSLASLGIVHASAGGALTSSLVVDGDIAVGTIANDKLATPATALATASTFVLRDASASFAADAIILSDGDVAAPSLVLGLANTGIFGDAGTVNISTTGVNRLAVSGSGALTLGAYSTGILHSGATGELTSSPIVNSDIVDLTITDAKLAQIATAGKVANSATTATSANTNDTIVARDSSGNFAATTITASLNGLASLNLPLAGGTMTGAIAAIAGTLAAPSVTMGTMGLSGGASFNVSSSGASRLNVSSAGITASSLASLGIVHASAGGVLTSSLVVNGDISVGTIANDKLATPATALATASTFVLRDANASFAADAIILNDGDVAAPSLVLGSANTGIFGDAGTVNISTDGVNRLAVSGSGALTLGAYSTGILHSGAAGELTSSLIVNSDIADLTITDSKLAQIATAGKVANSATTATSANTNDTIVARDGSGNFAATTITAALTGLASLNLPLAGGTMTGAIAAIAGTLAAPSVTMGTMGLSGGASFNVSSSGTSRLNVSSVGITASSLASLGIVHASAGGALTSSLVVNGDITVGTIANDKLATAATALSTASTFVLRDANASFAADAIILNDGDVAAPSLVLGLANTGIFGDAGTVNISTDGVNRLAVSGTGALTLGAYSTGILHSGASGELTSSPIVNSDIADLTITDAKLAQIATSGKVANSATTATSANTNDTIVARDGSGNFSATTITASLNGLASLNLPLAGGTMTGAIAAIAGTLAAPSVTMGTMGLSGGASFNVSSSGASRLNVSSAGITASSLASLGIVHASSGGALTSSLVVNGDITVGTIANDKLATPATALATASTFVLRDANASFAADAIILGDGDAAAPSLVLGSANTGIFGDAGTVNVSTAGVNRLAVSGSGALTLGAYSTGILHSGASGELTSSPIVNSDIADLTITDAKLAQIATSGKVANSATTATSANTNDTIVARDGSGNFSATTITASLNGLASLNLPLAGGTMTGAIAAIAGTLAVPSVTMGTMGLSGGASFNVSSSGTSRLSVSSAGITASSLASLGIVHASAGGALTSSLVVNGDITVGTIANDKLATPATALATASTFVLRDANASFAAEAATLSDGDAASPSLALGSANTGIFGDAGTVNISTAGVNRLAVSGAGALTLGSYSTGILHSGASGELTSSLIVNSDIADLTITDAKLAQIATAGKVANSATTATSANTNDAIVARDGSGNFSATTITASLTGLASLNLPLSGGTMTGAIAAVAGSLAAPSVTMGTVGLSGGASFDVSSSGTSRLSVSSAGITASSLASLGIVHASAGGALTSSLVVNGDITVGTITNDRLATAATALATASTFVLRDASASFAAEAVDLGAGTAANPSLLVGAAGTGLFGASGGVNIATGSMSRLIVSSAGQLTASAYGTGLIHSNSGGSLTSSLIVNADIQDAVISDTKLQTIGAFGKVLNSATTATDANTNSAIVARSAIGDISVSAINTSSINSSGQIQATRVILTNPGNQLFRCRNQGIR